MNYLNLLIKVGNYATEPLLQPVMRLERSAETVIHDNCRPAVIAHIFYFGIPFKRILRGHFLRPVLICNKPVAIVGHLMTAEFARIARREIRQEYVRHAIIDEDHAGVRSENYIGNGS